MTKNETYNNEPNSAINIKKDKPKIDDFDV